MEESFREVFRNSAYAAFFQFFRWGMCDTGQTVRPASLNGAPLRSEFRGRLSRHLLNGTVPLFTFLFTFSKTCPRFMWKSIKVADLHAEIFLCPFSKVLDVSRTGKRSGFQKCNSHEDWSTGCHENVSYMTVNVGEIQHICWKSHIFNFYIFSKMYFFAQSWW